MFESSVELAPEQVEWLDKCTQGTGSWKLNPTTGEVDVDRDFNCDDQGLSDFKRVRFGKVGGGFSCDNNQLSSLEGAPREVGGSFICRDNQLTSLEGAPLEVGGDFYCGDNQLTSLEGAPREVGKNFYCGDNQLTSLEGAPREVGKNFYCRGNPVSSETLRSIFGLMKKGKSYLEAAESIWPEIPLEDQILLYRPEFGWVGSDEARKLVSLKAYQGFKFML